MHSKAGESGFNIDVGLHQGSALSPYIYTLYVPHTNGCTNRGGEERSTRIHDVCGRHCTLWRYPPVMSTHDWVSGYVEKIDTRERDEG